MGSATNEVSIAASAASTALPPARRTSAPAAAVRGWPAATTPVVATPLVPGDELRHVDLAGRNPTRLAARSAGAVYPRLADRLTERRALVPRSALLAVAGGDHGDPHLV